MRRDFIQYQEYEKICVEQSINKSGQKTLIDFLHDLGIVLNFHDDKQRPQLKETNVLNPEWITQSIYKLLNERHLVEQQGVLKLSQLTDFLDLKRYPVILKINTLLSLTLWKSLNFALNFLTLRNNI